MAYQRLSARVLAGGINLTAPTDLQPDGNSMELENFESDTDGQLRSRRGALLQSSSQSKAFDSLYRHGNDRYARNADGLYFGQNYDGPIVDGFDGTPLSYAAYQDSVWIMNRAKQVRMVGSSNLPFGIPAPTAAPTAAAVGGSTAPIEGDDIAYYVTFYDGYQESGPSPISLPLITSGTAVLVSDIQTPPLVTIAIPPFTITVPTTEYTKRRLYRIGGGLDTALLVATIDDPLQTTYTDELSNDDLTALDIELPLDNDLPPAARGILGPYFGKLVAWNTDAHPARYFWSLTGKPYAWPGANDEGEGNWEDAGDEADELLQVTDHKRLLIFYKRKSIWRLQGDPDLNDPERCDVQLGLMGRYAVVNAGDYDYILCEDGIYRFNGDNAVKISKDLDPIFRIQYAPVADDGAGNYIVFPPMERLDQTKVDKYVLGYRDSVVYFSYCEVGWSVPNIVLQYNINTNRWSMGRWRVNADSFLGDTPNDVNSGAPLSQQIGILGGFLSFFNEGGRDPIVAASSSGGIWALDYNDTDGVNPIRLVWTTPTITLGHPDSQKMYGEIAIDYQAALAAGQIPSSLSLWRGFDGSVPQSFATLSSPTRVTARFPLSTTNDALGRKAHSAMFRITGDVSSTVILYGVYLYYYFETRKARAFDSGVISLGTQLVKTGDRIEIEITASAAVNWSIHTDLIGNSMVERASGSVPGTSGARVTYPVNIGDLVDGGRIDGRFYRLMLSSAREFELHNLRVRIQPMGGWADPSQPWESEVMRIGS